MLWRPTSPSGSQQLPLIPSPTNAPTDLQDEIFNNLKKKKEKLNLILSQFQLSFHRIKRRGKRNKKSSRIRTAHVREFPEGIGIHLGAQSQKGSDYRCASRHFSPSPWSSVCTIAYRSFTLKVEAQISFFVCKFCVFVISMKWIHFHLSPKFWLKYRLSPKVCYTIFD